MKKRVILIPICCVIFFAVAPVYVSSEYASDSTVDFPEGEGFAYTWVKREETFRYFLLFGVWNFRNLPDCSFVLRTKTKNFDSFRIKRAEAIIDEKRTSLDELEGRTHEIDTGIYNMYGGDGGTGMINFKLNSIPQESINMIIEGTLLNSDKKVEETFIYSKNFQIVKENKVILMFSFVKSILTAT